MVLRTTNPDTADRVGVECLPGFDCRANYMLPQGV